MRLVVLEGPPLGGAFEIGARGATIGRAESCEVVLDHADVSREHARVVATPEGFAVEDLGSRNGTVVNSELIRARQVLRDGDLLLVGATLFLVEDAAAPSVLGGDRGHAARQPGHAPAPAVETRPPRGPGSPLTPARTSLQAAEVEGRRLRDRLPLAGAALAELEDRPGLHTSTLDEALRACIAEGGTVEARRLLRFVEASRQQPGEMHIRQLSARLAAEAAGLRRTVDAALRLFEALARHI